MGIFKMRGRAVLTADLTGHEGEEMRPGDVSVVLHAYPDRPSEDRRTLVEGRLRPSPSCFSPFGNP